VRRLAYLVLRLLGWSFAGEVPPHPKFIVLGAPHTSNWDFVVFLAALEHFGLRARFLAKRGLFRWPFGPLFRALGGIPVGGPGPGAVPEAIAEFRDSDEMILVIAPEGSRAWVPHWRTGFVAIAEAAGVPIVLAGLDFSARTLTIGPVIDYEGDLDALMARARDFYAGMSGLHPAREGPVALPPAL
jgi:1-acyl-sn-glycerol-3-phosphate acyltransferase